MAGLTVAPGVAVFNQDISPRGISLKLFIDINWSSEVGEKLVAASYRMNRFDVLTRTIGRKAVTSIRRGIQQGRSPDGRPFAPLRNPRAPGRPNLGGPLYDSGKLAGDIQYKMISDREVMVGHTRETWYGLLHNIGVRHPWTITAKGKKVLRFWTSSGWHFARSVVHPGLVQRKFLGLRIGDLPDVPRILGDWAQKVFDPAAALGFGMLEGE